MIKPTKILSTAHDGPVARLTCDVGLIEITAYAPNIIHFAYYPSPDHRPLPMWGVSAKPQIGNIKTRTNDHSFIIDLPEITIEFDLRTAQYVARAPRSCSSPLLQSLSYSLEPAVVSNEKCFHLHAAFDAPSDEHYYGLGQHQLGWMDHRGQTVKVWHDYQAEGGEIIGVPILITNKNYALIFDNTSRVTVRPGIDNQTTWNAEVGHAISYFIIAGETTDKLYAGYRLLTGETPLPPKSALGYIQCKQRYTSRDELLAVAKKYRELHYPCDMLIVDWFHWKTLGDLDLDPALWPDAAEMNRELAAMNYDVMISCWPRFMKESRHYNHLESNHWFMTETPGRGAESKTLYGTSEDQRGAVIDTTNPAAAQWFWDTVRDSYAAKGFSSWWLDENEPDICPHPYYLQAGTGAAVHNLYPLTHTQAVYEGHTRDLPSRCLILSRSAYLGAQRNGTTFWSSDIHPNWDVLRRQIPAGLNFCASGFPYWSSDIGGWQELPSVEPTPPSAVPPIPNTHYPIPNIPLILLDPSLPEIYKSHPDYLELYVRWFQFGAFCPTFRAHGSRPQNEVWSYGPIAEKILVKFLQLRYRLLPYIYSLAFDSYRTGAPFMRALFMDFPNDPAVADIKDQYMFGPAFLVAPVVHQGATSRSVYLPASTSWYDYWTGQKFQGGQSIEVPAPIDTIPLFVRAGSIIPHGNPIEHTKQPQTQIELHIYPGADAHFTLYHDDGTSRKYQQGDYHLTPIHWNDKAQKLTIEADPLKLFTAPQSTWLRMASTHSSPSQV